MGGMLSQPITVKEIHEGSTTSLRWTSCEMQGWRQYMQDAKITQQQIPNHPQMSLFAVFDGHGGAEVAKYVGNHFVAELIKRKSFQEKRYGDALKETFIQVQLKLKSKDGIIEQIIHKCQTTKTQNVTQQQLAAGCTANVVLITPEKIYIANAGDSRSVIMKNDKSIALSEDHKPSLKREQQRIIQSGGKIIDGRVNGNLNLTRAIGDFRQKAVPGIPFNKQPITCLPDIKQIDRDGTQQFIVIACDGIWQRQYESNVDLLLRKFKKQLQENIPAKQILQSFFDEHISKQATVPYGKDNMTAIIVEFIPKPKV